MTRSGGQILADGLVAHGSELAFCVPGESYLALLDGLYEHRDRFRIVNCRHEGAAANAADAYGKLTGRPGICMVTRGPGATHAATGVHTARQDSTPLILLVGQIARAERGRESFQELDYEAVFGSMAKWAFEIDDPARIPEVLARAYAVATSGRPGPVVLSLPEDVLSGSADVADAPRYQRAAARARPARAGRARGDARARRAAVRARRRRAAGTTARRRAFTRWALDCGLPVGATFRRQDVVDNRLRGLRRRRRPRHQPAARAAHPRLRPADRRRHAPGRDRDAGLHAARAAGRAAAARARAPRPGRARARLPARARRCSAASRSSPPPRRVVDGSRWAELGGRGARATTRRTCATAPAPGDGVDLGDVIAHLREALPRRRDPHQRRGQLLGLGRAATTSGARFGTQLGPQSGAMGYGIPAALAAQLLHPERARDRVRRRRRLPDVRAGARDRRAGGAADPRGRGQQRHLRHDPHAPGAPLPRARDRHRPRQPGLRGARARLRRARRASRGRRGFPGRARAGARRAAAPR